jgi:hypothetical protein
MFQCYFSGQSSDLSLFDFGPYIYGGFKWMSDTGVFYPNNLYGALFVLFLIMLLFKKPFRSFRIVIISFSAFIFLAESLNVHEYNRTILFMPILFSLIAICVQIKNANSLNFLYKIVIKIVIFAICISFPVGYYFEMYKKNTVWFGRTPIYEYSPVKQLANLDIPQYKSTEEAGKVIENYIRQHSNGDTSLFVNDAGSGISTFIYDHQIPDTYYFFNAIYKPFENVNEFRDKIYANRKHKWIVQSIKVYFPDQVLSPDLMKEYLTQKSLWANYKPVLALNQFGFMTILFERKD